MKIKPGDVVSVNGEHGATWFGEIVGKNEFSRYEIFYISEKNGIITYDEDHNEIEKESIIIHVPNRSDYVEAWSRLGFRYDPTNNLFTPINDFDNRHVHDTDDELFTGSSSDGSFSLGSMDSWSSSDDEDDYTEEDKHFLLE